MLISPTEPAKLKAVGQVSLRTEKYGADVLIVANRQLTGVQRKLFPADLLASLSDKRLYEQLQKMRPLDRRVLVLEGYGKWTVDGALMDSYTRFTKSQLHGLMATLAFEHDMMVVQTKDLDDTIGFVTDLDRWCHKTKHTALQGRGSAPKDSWGKVTDRAFSIHLLQSFPNIGPEIAGRIVDLFGKAPLRWEVTVDDLMQVPGIGKATAQRLWEAMDG